MLLGQEPDYSGPDEGLDRKIFVAALGVLGGGLSFLVAMMFLFFPDWVSPRTFRTWFRVPAARAVSVFVSTGADAMAGMPVVLARVALDQGDDQMSGQVADPLAYDAITSPPPAGPVGEEISDTVGVIPLLDAGQVAPTVADIAVLPPPPPPQWEASGPVVSEPRDPVTAEPGSTPAVPDAPPISGITPTEPVSEPVPTSNCSTDPTLCASVPPSPPATSSAPANAGPPPNPGPPPNVGPPPASGAPPTAGPPPNPGPQPNRGPQPGHGPPSKVARGNPLGG